METWKIAQGSATVYTVTINDSSGNPIAYTGTEALAAVVWAGNDQLPLATLTPVWANAPAGQVTVLVPAATTANLKPGLYRFRIVITDAGGAHDAYENQWSIARAPGSAALRPTYIDASDVRKIWPEVDDYQSPDADDAGFLDQCADSRDWIDELMLRNYRGGNISLLGYHGLALDAWYTGGVRRTSLTNIWLKQQLAANTLIVTPRIRRVCAFYAAYQIAQGNVSRDKTLKALAASFRMQASALAIATTFELNLNGDGVTPSLPINLSSTNTLFG